MNPSDRRGFYKWKPSACLQVSGADSADFLQGQFTNDLHKAGPGDVVYGLWLDQKGKVLADSFILRKSSQEFWIISYFSAATVIRARLEAYVVADDVVIEDRTGEMAGLTVLGGNPAADWVPTGGWSFAGRRTREPNAEVIFPVSMEADMDAKLERAVLLSGTEVERRRIAAGIPAVPADIGPTDLPNEGRLETDAISYTKGCYLGQEVMARLKSMGQVRRGLLGVRGDGKQPAVPAPLYHAGKKAGELRSVVAEGAGWTGLAMVSLMQIRSAPGLALTVDGAPGVSLVVGHD